MFWIGDRWPGLSRATVASPTMRATTRLCPSSLGRCALPRTRTRRPPHCPHKPDPNPYCDIGAYIPNEEAPPMGCLDLLRSATSYLMGPHAYNPPSPSTPSLQSAACEMVLRCRWALGIGHSRSPRGSKLFIAESQAPAGASPGHRRCVLHATCAGARPLPDVQGYRARCRLHGHAMCTSRAPGA